MASTPVSILQLLLEISQHCWVAEDESAMTELVHIASKWNFWDSCFFSLLSSCCNNPVCHHAKILIINTPTHNFTQIYKITEFTKLTSQEEPIYSDARLDSCLMCDYRCIINFCIIIIIIINFIGHVSYKKSVYVCYLTKPVVCHSL